MSIIHGLLEDIVKTEDGPAQLAAVRAIASEYSPGHDGVAKVAAFATALGQVRSKSVVESYRSLGAALIPRILRAFPVLILANKSTMSLLMHINQVGPAILDAVLPEASPPEFDVELLGSDHLRLRFTASEHVSALVEGAVGGSAAHFSEKAECTWVASESILPDKRVLDIVLVPGSRPTLLTPAAIVIPRKFGTNKGGPGFAR